MTPPRPPQTEEEERCALLFELGTLTGLIHRRTGAIPALIAALPRYADADRIDFREITNAHVGDLCAELRTQLALLASE